MADVLTSGQRAATQPAAKALGYGRRAAGSGTRVAKAPAKKSSPQPRPAHVVAAEAELQKLPDKIEMTIKAKKVTRSIVAIKRQLKVHDMKAYRKISPAVVRAGFDAWTSSRGDIWVSPTAVRADHWLRAVVFHEVLHVVQFRLASRPPTKYEEMVEFECAAYTDTADFVAVPAKHPNHPGIDNWEPTVRSIASMFCNQLTIVTTKNARARDREFRRFLIGKDMLPPHKKIGDLYP